MVDIELDVLTTTLSRVNKDNLLYKVRTVWCQVDIDAGNTCVRLPQLQIIDHYLLNKEETVLFLEIWDKDADSSERPKFIGLSRCTAGRLLENPNINPSVQWWDIYNPVEDVVLGKVLLQIYAKFSVKLYDPFTGKSKLESKEAECNNSKTQPPPLKPASSYFSSKNTSTESQKADITCKEVQTDLSLILWSNVTNNEYKNYNNTTRSNLASDQSTNISSSISNTTGDTIGRIFTKASTAARSKTLMLNAASAIPKTSEMKTVEDKSQIKMTQRNKGADIPLLRTKSVIPTETSSSVDNIISLLNDHNVTPDSAALPYGNEYCKSDKNHYNKSKLNEQGRQAPEGRNEADSDILTPGTSNQASPAKSTKLTNFLAQVPRPRVSTPFRQNYKGQYDPSKYHTRSENDRPSRMAASLSFKPKQ